MKIVLCNGGLGNQTFQYIFSRFIELAGGEPCFLDDSAFFIDRPEHNGYELGRVFPHSKPRLLSSAFDSDVWDYMVKKGNIVQQLKDAGEDITLVAETADYSFDGNVVPVQANAFAPWIANCKGNIYYHGYWINRDWLKSEFASTIEEELSFPEVKDSRNRSYLDKIEFTESVAIHVRRGDFLNCGWTVPVARYRELILAMRERVPGAHFFIFSDDVQWCRENREAMGLLDTGVTYVEGNMGGNNYIDMQLMSNCKYTILATTSSFSYLAALLNKNANGFVLNATGRQV